MASIEYLNKRIDGKRKEIEKLTKKLERIEKAEATGWEVNPYYYSANDKKWALRDLETAKAALENYKAELKTEEEKAGSRNVEAILKFLENWKIRVKEFYAAQFIQYKKERAELSESDAKYYEKERTLKYNSPEYKEAYEEQREAHKAFNYRWNFIEGYVDRKFNGSGRQYELIFNHEKLAKELDREANLKYDDIINRTNEITGKITDASCLDVGEKGELNGYIIGERGTAKVTTIGAGGYNIQCFHFRTLVHAM